jgi:DNA-binding winged helix-turn-helix (wHTH) protein
MAEFTFGPYSLTTDGSKLTRDGAEVPLRPRAFHALRVLLSHSGSVVDYDTIITEGWEGVHVSRHTVDVTLAEVRRRLGEYGRWIEHRGKYGYALQVPMSEELVRQGWHFWSQRTRAGCERAIDCFTRVSADCSSNFRAFEGLSASYLALAVFGMRCPLTMYSRFLEAHKRAVALTGLRPELRCDRAFGLHLFERIRFAPVRASPVRSGGRVPADLEPEAVAPVGVCPARAALRCDQSLRRGDRHACPRYASRPPPADARGHRSPGALLEP